MEQIAQEEEERRKRESLIEPGEEVSVVRTNGGIDSGWTVRGPHPERYNTIVVRQEKEELLSKEVSTLALYAQNRPEMEGIKFAFEGWRDLWERSGGDPREEFDSKTLLRIDRQGGLSPREARDFFSGVKSTFEKFKESGERIELSAAARRQAAMREAYFGKPMPPEFTLSDEEIRRVTGT